MKTLATISAIVAALAPASAAGSRCTEDQPCWNWATMGDHTRGVVTMWGNQRVVGPIRFCRLDRDRNIDWTSTNHMKGDATARKAC